ncbi:MAG TPA: bacillithiol system redox-active protein YtxJ [Planctomycetota bacterium]|nr:bacillithiol system redox-active protein YtxJ [Planctomycetota bacterium]
MKELASLEDLSAALFPAPGPVVIYKHSTQCGICDAALEEVQAFEEKNPAVATIYYLDLLAHRELSNAVARNLGIRHESPQAIVLRDGKPVAVLNHRAIRLDALARAAAISATQKP